LENIEITLKIQDGRLLLEANGNSAGSMKDNRAKQFIFSRPYEYEKCGLLLNFRDGEREFIPVNLGAGNRFAIPNALTQTDTLELQAAFERDGDILIHSNIIRFWLRPSIFEGANAVEQLPDILRETHRGAFASVSHQNGELAFFSMSGELLSQVDIGERPSGSGSFGSVSIGSVVTGDPGSSASVYNSGTLTDAIFDFVIPRGDKGERGADGTGVRILGLKPNPAALPSFAENGDAYMIDAHLWVWTGSNWADAGNIRGPQGEQGSQGQPGPQGPAGQDADAYSRSEADARFASIAAVNARLNLSGGTMTGQLIAQPNAAFTTAQARNAILSTADLVPGVSPLANGALYFVYE